MFPGIALPELIARDVAEDAVQRLLTTAEVLDFVMTSRPQAERDEMRTAIGIRPGKVRLGWSLEPEEDWQVTVFLANAAPNPRERTLGDVVGVVEEDELHAATLADTIDDSAGVTLALLGTLPAGLPPRGRVRIGNELAIYAISGSTVTLPHRGVQQTLAAAHEAGEIVFFHSLSQRTGWGEECTIRIDVLSSNAYLNLVLATTIKSALLLAAADFNAAGLTLRGISESDLTPRPTAWPAHLFNRTLTLSVQREFALPEEMPIITDTDAVVGIDEEGIDVRLPQF
jgi:hypothetical protein